MTNNRTGEVEEVMLGDEETTVQDDDVDQLNMVLYLKDMHNIFQIFELLKYVCKLLNFYALYRKHVS